MTLKEIADELVAGCRENRAKENLDRLYAPDAVSVEAMDMGGGTDTVGIAGIKGKHDWWEANHITHAAKVDGPFPNGADRFAVVFDIDMTTKETGQRGQMQEVAVYTVAGGKIVREEFFYGT